MPTAFEAKEELFRRAESRLKQQRLLVDYYRIRHKLAFPLPVRQLPRPDPPVRGIQRYPWSIWLAWDLEDRITSLGWAAQLSGRTALRQAAADDLAAMAAWPSYREYGDLPSLCLAHCARVMVTALGEWNWPEPSLRKALTEGLRRLSEDALPWFEHQYGEIEKRLETIRRDPAEQRKFHNIPLIEGLALAMALRVLGDPKAAGIDAVLEKVLRGLLDLREGGHTEGVAYDGYILEFVAGWLEGVAPEIRSGITGHGRFFDVLEETIWLAAPGAVAEAAVLSDVEPDRMPFHLSAEVLLSTTTSHPHAAWLIPEIPSPALSATALARLIQKGGDEARSPAPPAGVKDVHYAGVLRTGWKANDFAVAMAAGRSPMGHIHADNGTLVIGTGGRWLLTDPGYQQYMKTRERDFTLGPLAHNAPVINGHAQTRKEVERPCLQEQSGLLFASLDITRCYPKELSLTLVRRSVWLSPEGWAAVADEIEGTGIRGFSHTWHWAPEAFLEQAGQWIVCHYPDVPPLWFESPSQPFQEGSLRRLPGSRGHLSTLVDSPREGGIAWWFFTFGDRPVSIESADGTGSMAVAGKSLNPRGRLG